MPQRSEERETLSVLLPFVSQYASHLYRNMPPICIAILLGKSWWLWSPGCSPIRNQEKGVLAKGGFCRIQCHAQETKQYLRILVRPSSTFFGSRPNTVSGSTVSNTELSEFLAPHRVPWRELSEFLSAYFCVVERTHRVLGRTHRVCRKTQ